jgi:hypothetical protein
MRVRACVSVWMVAASTSNKQSRTADREWSSGLKVWGGGG